MQVTTASLGKWLDRLEHHAVQNMQRQEMAADSCPVKWLESVAPDITLDFWQKEFMLNQSRRALLLCSRQVGKSFSVAARAAHRAISKPNSTVLTIAPSYRQSQLLYSKIAKFVQADSSVRAVRNTQFELELSNGSSVVSLPGDSPDKVRGFSASFVAVDEASFVRDGVLTALFPMLSTTGGDIVMLSTPAGASGVFHSAWMNNEEEWDRTKVLATDCPRIPADFLAEAKVRLGDLGWRREYLCEFVSSTEAFFNSDQLAAAFAAPESDDKTIARAFK